MFAAVFHISSQTSYTGWNISVKKKWSSTLLGKYLWLWACVEWRILLCDVFFTPSSSSSLLQLLVSELLAVLAHIGPESLERSGVVLWPLCQPTVWLLLHSHWGFCSAVPCYLPHSSVLAGTHCCWFWITNVPPSRFLQKFWWLLQKFCCLVFHSFLLSLNSTFEDHKKRKYITRDYIAKYMGGRAKLIMISGMNQPGIKLLLQHFTKVLRKL